MCCYSKPDPYNNDSKQRGQANFDSGFYWDPILRIKDEEVSQQKEDMNNHMSPKKLSLNLINLNFFKPNSTIVTLQK